MARIYSCNLLGLASHPGWDGFLGTRASLAMDVVVVVLGVLLPCLAWSVWLARNGRYTLHRRIQLALTAALLLAVGVFEVDVRINGWQSRATLTGEAPSTAVWIALAIHLFFAITTVCLWPMVLILALRRFPYPPRPSEYSAAHRRWARLAAWDLAATAVTGWIFYCLAFVAW